MWQNENLITLGSDIIQDWCGPFFQQPSVVHRKWLVHSDLRYSSWQTIATEVKQNEADWSQPPGILNSAWHAWPFFAASRIQHSGLSLCCRNGILFTGPAQTSWKFYFHILGWPGDSVYLFGLTIHFSANHKVSILTWHRLCHRPAHCHTRSIGASYGSPRS